MLCEADAVVFNDVALREVRPIVVSDALESATVRLTV